ncbi:beta-ribofuranosylaminobenzene 5'-phosphate synthase family protein [uncultured Thiodictyon sp.]|uniref:beta-ribofuranosylaminobenzene 5'-phosphate synthase family protein n=1 Tax=uncultured Thiodictyon sp. TaxID=1846217 RepID=UPI0025FB3FFA|nr:beta-ribofuranosylaminobenzene 5'-phosphate synthase family protein [uncultured Thiodictyon sp.]
MTSPPAPLIHVDAPARLHLGFLDLNGGLGRQFGSLGLTIDAFATRLRAQRADTFSATGPGAERALAFARAFAAARGLTGGACIQLSAAIPDHAGLGSGTQMALAVGTALERLLDPATAGRPTDCRGIAQLLGRGQRSGIGIGAFEEGGFICDCGRGDLPEVPPVVMRLPFPAAWRVLLLLDRQAQGLHGEPESRAFAQLPEFPAATAGRLCRLLLMQLVPGLLDGRLAPVAEAIGEIQRAVGTHFAPVQGGCFTSPTVSAALAWATTEGFPGNGQSSWGPTGFILAGDEAQARWLERGLKARFGESSPLRYRITAGRNLGAQIVA